LQKFHVENFPEKIDKDFDVDVECRCQFFLVPRFFCFVVFLDVFRQIVSKTLYKKPTKKPKTIFFLDFVLSRFRAFLGEGCIKAHHQKKIYIYREKRSDPGPVLDSDPPTYHGGHRFFIVGGRLEQALVMWRARQKTAKGGGGRVAGAGTRAGQTKAHRPTQRSAVRFFFRLLPVRG
jgi:hypothetical protein